MTYRMTKSASALLIACSLTCVGAAPALAEESLDAPGTEAQAAEAQSALAPQAQDGWHEHAGVWSYVQDGTSVTGWLEMWSTWYFFNESGAMVTGWQTIDGADYYFYPSGAMATEWVTLDDGTYYFGLNGYKRTGWLFLNGSWYWLGEDGRMVTGWAQIDNETYHFEPDGEMSASWSYDDGWYHFTWSGSRSLGLQCIDETWYFFDDEGRMLTGWNEIDGSRRFFMSSGAMRTGWLLENGLWYWLGDDGAVKTGWLEQGGSRYYLSPELEGAMLTGWHFIDGAWHVFSDTGQEMTAGWVAYGNGWVLLNEDGSLNSGWVYADDERHYFEANGVARSGWLCEDGRWYFLDERGVPATGQIWLEDLCYLFDEQGVMQTGWVGQNGGWYYFGESGYLHTWDRKEGNEWYCYFAENGKRLSGFVGLWGEDGSYRTCYYDPVTFARASGSLTIDGVTFFFDPQTGALEGEVGSIPLYINNLVRTAWDDSHGYDQEYRWGQYGDYDCSSLTVVCADEAGIPVGDASFTGDMREGFLQSTLWEWIPWKSDDQLNTLRAGDVLLKEFSHVYTYLGGGQIAEAQYNEFHGAVGGEPGDQTGVELLVRPTYLYHYGLDGILRYHG